MSGFIDDEDEMGMSTSTHDDSLSAHDDDAHEQPTAKSPVEAQKPAKKPMKKAVKIAIGAVGAVVAMVGFVAFDMQRQQSASSPALADDPAMSAAEAFPAAAITQPAPLASASSVEPSTTVTTAASSVIAASQAVSQPVSVPYDEVKMSEVEQTQNARLDRIEAFLMSNKNAATKPQPKESRSVQPVSGKNAPDKKRNTGHHVADSKPGKPGKPGGSNCSDEHASKLSAANQKPVASIPTYIEPVPVVKRAICEYRGGINNRAWVTCDDELRSVKRGDALPYPYGVVTDVNDQAGSVSTSAGGIIQ